MDKAKNIIITGEEVDFNFEELKSMGVSVYHYPMISISKIDNQIDSNDYDYIIFTSKNGVRYFLKNLSSKINRNLKFICIGNKTAQLLVENKLNPYFIVKRNYSQFMCEEIKGLNIDKKAKILLVLWYKPNSTKKISFNSSFTEDNPRIVNIEAKYITK